jgi:hypothetical protein
MMFSIPAIVPVPAPRGMVALPTGAIGLQLFAGQREIKLPSYVLKKAVSRRSLEVAIHAIAPILEAAERVVRPRWSWVSHPLARRAIGLFVFLLALAIAYPLFEFKALHAMSVFAVSLGMAEQDGLAVVIGLVAGVLSLTMVAAFGVSSQALRVKVQKTLRKVLRRLRHSFLGRFLERLGFARLGRILTMEWNELLLMWDPAKREAERRARAARAPVAERGVAPRVERSVAPHVERSVATRRPPAVALVPPPVGGKARPAVGSKVPSSSVPRRASAGTVQARRPPPARRVQPAAQA